VFVFGVCSGIRDAKGLIARLREASGRLGVFAEAFDPEAVVSERQLLLAHMLAGRAFAEKRGIAKAMETEVLLRAAATGKIGEAIGRVGVKEPSQFLLLTDADGEKLERLLKAVEGKKVKAVFGGEKAAKLYGVEKLKGYSLEDLVLERMAMLAAER